MMVKTAAEEALDLPVNDQYALAYFAWQCRETNSNGNYKDGFAVERGRGSRRINAAYEFLIRHGFVVQTGWNLRGDNWYRMSGGDAELKAFKRIIRDTDGAKLFASNLRKFKKTGRWPATG